jgi:putative SOS response-associated peptidase YedK
MPVILSKIDQAAWIDPDNRDSGRLLSMLKPYPSDEMKIRAADPSTLQLKPKNFFGNRKPSK